MTAQHFRAPRVVRPAVHRTILVVDMEGSASFQRTNLNQVAARDGMYRALHRAFHQARIRWTRCYHEDRGDGVFILAPADIPKSLFVESLPVALAAALDDHNRRHPPEERIRLRMAIHAGEVNYDDHGVTARAINLAFRLVSARPLREALARSAGPLALITSSWFFDEVVRNRTAGTMAAYSPVQVGVKETNTVGWICLPDQLSLPRVNCVAS
jgi:class 3 adenylate cyclase